MTGDFMKLTDSFLPGAQARIEAELKRADAGDKGFAFALALVSELAGKMDAELKAIRADVAEGRKSIADAYQGPHRKDKSYPRGSLTTCKGSLWLALMDTSEAPGASADWRLVSKGGEVPKHG